MSVLPKPLRSAYYWINRQGKLGKWVVNAGSYGFMWGVKAFNIRPWQDLAALTIISHKHKFIYIGIPKIATRSFQTLFIKERAAEFEIEWSEKPNGFRHALTQHPDYFAFAFVRNPWSRIVSCYNSKIAGCEPGKQARIMSFYEDLNPQMSFADFVSFLCSEEGRDAIADRHWISQHLFLERCDYIGKYENLEQDWRVVCDKIGLKDLELPHKGWVSEDRDQEGDYRSYYTDETRDMIAKRYAKDIELYGYNF